MATERSVRLAWSQSKMSALIDEQARAMMRLERLEQWLQAIDCSVNASLCFGISCQIEREQNYIRDLEFSYAVTLRYVADNEPAHNQENGTSELPF